jgi:hypothetical protein
VKVFLYQFFQGFIQAEKLTGKKIVVFHPFFFFYSGSPDHVVDPGMGQLRDVRLCFDKLKIVLESTFPGYLFFQGAVFFQTSQEVHLCITPFISLGRFALELVF